VITQVEIASSLSGIPALSLGTVMPNSDPVQIRSIDGLGPVKAETASTPFATGRGEMYQGINTGKRNIVLNLGLNPNWIDQTMASLRQLLYRYFMPEVWSTLTFSSDELPDVWIRGVTESFEPNLFSQDPEIQVSIICPKPDFIDGTSILVTGVTNGAPHTINYTGTVPVGFELRVNAASYSGGLTVGNDLPDPEDSQLWEISGLALDSSVYFDLNTVRSTRHAYIVPVADSEFVTNVLGKMNSDSDWPELMIGANNISVSAADPGLDWTLGYLNRFGGL